MRIDESINNQNFSEQEITGEDYDNCTFSKCNFTNTTFRDCRFTDCVFDNCNISMTKMPETTLSNVVFDNCKILGVNFNHCNNFIFEVNFKNSVLDYSSFEKRKMIKTLFFKCSLKGVDFGLANLKQSVFDECDLTDTVFYNTNLQEVDFRTSYNYLININENAVKKARFSKDGLSGLLATFNIIIE